MTKYNGVFGCLSAGKTKPTVIGLAGPRVGSTNGEIMNENDAIEQEIIKSDVWHDPEAANTIVVHEHGRIAAYFNCDGDVVIAGENVFGGDDVYVSFDHKHIQSLILRLQEMAGEDPTDYMSVEYLAARAIIKAQSKGGNA